MQTALAARFLPPPAQPASAAHGPHQYVLDWGDDHHFVAMLNAYRDSGGLARVQELLALFKRNGGPDVATFTGWIDRREVICFEWREETWFPWFQLNRLELAPHPQLRIVFAELAPVYDHWELANWFAQPNAWLADRTPLETMGHDVSAVLYAARADRFVATG